jgi:hypothetical protein
MKKIKCTVTKVYEYEVELDEKVWTEEELKNWSTCFCDVDDLQELAEQLSLRKTDYEDGQFIEGFGVPMINGKKPFVWGDNKDSINESVNINIITDGEADVESEVID